MAKYIMNHEGQEQPPRAPRASIVPPYLEERMPGILQEHWLDRDLTMSELQNYIYEEYGYKLSKSQLDKRITNYGKRKKRRPASPTDSPHQEIDGTQDLPLQAPETQKTSLGTLKNFLDDYLSIAFGGNNGEYETNVDQPQEKEFYGILTFEPTISPMNFFAQHRFFLSRFYAVAACSGFQGAANDASREYLSRLSDQVERYDNQLEHTQIASEIIRTLMRMMRLDRNRTYLDSCVELWFFQLRGHLNFYQTWNSFVSHQGLELQRLAQTAYDFNYPFFYRYLSSKIALPEPRAILKQPSIINRAQSQYKGQDVVWPIIRTILLEMERVMLLSAVQTIDNKYAILWDRAPSYGHIELLERQISLAYLCGREWQSQKQEYPEDAIDIIPTSVGRELISGDVPALTISVLLCMTSSPVWHGPQLGMENWHIRTKESIELLLKDQTATVKGFLDLAKDCSSNDIPVMLYVAQKAMTQIFCHDPIASTEYVSKSLAIVKEIVHNAAVDHHPSCPVVVDRTMRGSPQSLFSSYCRFKRSEPPKARHPNDRSPTSSHPKRFNIIQTSTGSLPDAADHEIWTSERFSLATSSLNGHNGMRIFNEGSDSGIAGALVHEEFAMKKLMHEELLREGYGYQESLRTGLTDEDVMDGEMDENETDEDITDEDETDVDFMFER